MSEQSERKLEERIARLEKEVEIVREEAHDKEVKNLKWGIRILGSVVLVMGGWIWSQVGHLFDFGGGQ